MDAPTTRAGGRPSLGITALGSYAPPTVVTNADFEARLDTTAEWIESRTGIRERHYSAPDEFTSHMGIGAVRDLLSRDPDALRGVDVVICATASPDALFPSTAALIAGQVGLAGCGAFDLSTACSGFVYGLSMAQGLILAGTARRVLVVGGEVLTKIVDQDDRNTAILFGDGAGAAVVGPVPEGYGFQEFILGADSAGGPALFKGCIADRLPDGTRMGPKADMNGREVFKFAVRVLGNSGTEVLKKTGLGSADVDWVIPHQANIRIIEAAMDRFGIPMEKTVVNLDRYGNTSSATIPLVLREAVDDGRVRDGQQLLLVAFGGGLSWAAGTMRWWGGAPSLHARAHAEAVA
ncbi:3-oxoacyl-[acyl-carrier-protein] synthase-3 [Deinococcus metalli]|uniref:Beta-ketoacyl-[acyl-carrier-protein] synthase III n=1 Tax=Deinococcus metalli TaxID=1141878 RepID=A0A7W8NU36_9DEIO|nr:beta-ketoacyl-ACP synthase III [Deinococcus metalli]MBB5378907.1 3-oxoacyl-[acyl-carrier-protein] synthase-3 [Deinococcus metalli]GHF62651.1 3-oxoacyl-[acyl-carrier-protein] synthase 3 protein 1 [Deinococcus metalli]